MVHSKKPGEFKEEARLRARLGTPRWSKKEQELKDLALKKGLRFEIDSISSGLLSKSILISIYGDIQKLKDFYRELSNYKADL